LIFQLADLPAQWRLGNVQVLRRAAEMEFFGQGQEIAKLSQINSCIHTEKVSQKWYWMLPGKQHRVPSQFNAKEIDDE
jgi:hypothetical protein